MVLKATPADTVKGEVHSTLTDNTVSGAADVAPGIKSALVNVIAVVFVRENANSQSATVLKENGLGLTSSDAPVALAVVYAFQRSRRSVILVFQLINASWAV